MTVFDFIPYFDVNHTDDRSRWCQIVTDCLDGYEAICGSSDYPGQRYCIWPILDRKEFSRQKKWGRLDGYESFEQYQESGPEVVYYMDYDQFISNVRNTDGTLDCAFQDNRFLCYVHIGGSRFFSEEGFGCVIDKFTNEMHCVLLGEDDGNYWGDEDIDIGELSGYEVSLISSVVNHLPPSDFWDRDGIIDRLWKMRKV